MIQMDVLQTSISKKSSAKAKKFNAFTVISSSFFAFELSVLTSWLFMHSFEFFSSVSVLLFSGDFSFFSESTVLTRLSLAGFCCFWAETLFFSLPKSRSRLKMAANSMRTFGIFSFDFE